MTQQQLREPPDTNYNDIAPAHHHIGSAALVEMCTPGGGSETHLVECVVTGHTSAYDRPYRIIVQLKGGYKIGPCAPECVLST